MAQNLITDKIQLGLFVVQGFQFFFMLFQTAIYRSKEYVYYTFYILCSILYLIGLNFHSLDLNPSKSLSLLLLDKPMAFLCYFFYFKFAKYFLDIPSRYPEFAQKLKGIELILLTFSFAMVLSALFLNTITTEILFSIFGTISIPFALYSVYKFNRIKENRLNYFVVIGASLIIFAAVSTFAIMQIQLFYPEARSYPSNFHYHLIVLFELLVFSVGLGYKSYRTEYEKSKLSRDLLVEQLDKALISERLNYTRNKIAKDLHDDLGASISGIRILADLSYKSNNDDKVKQIYEITEEILVDFTDASWILSPNEDSLESLVFKLQKNWNSITKAKQVKLNIQIDEMDRLVPLNILQKKNLYLICKESINNSLKHSGGTEINVNFEVKNNNLYFTIADNGEFKTLQSNHKNGLENLKLRMLELNGDFNCKTVVGESVIIGGQIPLSHV